MEPIDKNRFDPAAIKKLVRSLVTVSDNDMGCTECFSHVDRYADMLVEGQDPSQVMPLVKDHLETCLCCKEELEALIKALEYYE